MSEKNKEHPEPPATWKGLVIWFLVGVYEKLVNFYYSVLDFYNLTKLTFKIFYNDLVKDILFYKEMFFNFIDLHKYYITVISFFTIVTIMLCYYCYLRIKKWRIDYEEFKNDGFGYTVFDYFKYKHNAE